MTTKAQIDNWISENKITMSLKAYKELYSMIDRKPVAFVTQSDVACFNKGLQGEIAALLHKQGMWNIPLYM